MQLKSLSKRSKWRSEMGVDLSEIVKDMVKYEGGHPCVLAIKNLESFTEIPTDSHQLLDYVQYLKSPSNSDFAVRKVLISMNAVNILLNLFDMYFLVGDYSVCALLLNALSTVITGHSYAVNEEHIKKLVNMLLKLIDELDRSTLEKSHFVLIAAVYQTLHLSCTKNEKNRALISQTQAVTQTIHLLKKLGEIQNNMASDVFYPTLKESCAFLRSLTVDDDLDVEFGLGSENARSIAKSDSCLEVFINLISNILNASNVNGISDLFQTLSAIITREELCTKFASLDGINILMKTIYYNIKSISIVSSGLMLLQALCGSDACKRSVGSWSMHDTSGPQLIIDVFEDYIKSPIVTKYVAGVIAAVTLRQPDLAKSLVSSGAAIYLTKTLDLHLSNATTVRTVCRAIRNCVARAPELQSTFLASDCGIDTGLEKLLNSALKIPACYDDAKAALRDLNCAVELHEPWKGQLKSVVIDSG
ncbi:unnamed protein product [Heterobilharzia americana]|nr:unnamed protein product [Heterobilharzia americana]